MAPRIIVRDVEPDDWILAIRAVKALMGKFQKDIVISYGDGDRTTKDFYVRRNKSSITVRPCGRADGKQEAR